MKEKGSFGLLAVVLLFVIALGVIPVSAATITIDPATQYQTIEGWGTSLCWWGNVVGKYPDTPRNAINDLIFSSSGLGFNIVRYNIGGGENPSHEHMRAGGEMEGFEPSSGTWNWNADAGQRKILSESVSRGVNIVEAFSNSPPYWMTNSSCASGASSSSSNNLQDSQYTAFATYLTEVTKHFRDSWGITFRTLEPLNESVSSYWGANGSQEGCHFDRAKQNQIIKEVGAQLASKGLTGTKVGAPDESVLEDTITSYNSYDSTAKGYISQINAHTYGGSNRIGVRDLARSAGKKLWMSEVDNGGGVAHNHNDIKPGLWLANAIKNDLINMQPIAWIFWQAVENEQNMAPGRENSNWGLIHSDFENGGSNYYITKKYYVMGNYSKFIRPGYKMIGCNDSRAVAAYDQTGGKLAIVYTNDTTGAISNTIDLSRFGTVSGSATVYRTSGSENLAQSNASITNKLLTVSAPANSVTTYVISLSGSNPTPTPSLTATPTRRVTPTPASRQTPTPSTTVTPTRRVSNTPTPPPGGGYVVAYVIQSDWGTGGTTNVTIINNTATAVNGWTLAWTFPGNQTITNLWNGSYTQSGASVSVKDAGYNAAISANGGTTNFGFNFNYSGANAKPTSFTLNGTACQVQ
ncbi:MAG TPA: glycoside hydrolase [Bacillota bacterium]|nr:glycoside hydrolase [Bacillota bacterium]